MRQTTASNCLYVVYILYFHRDTVHHVRGTLPETLTRMGEKDMKEHLPASVTTCKMVYIPNIGYLLAITGWNPSPADNADLGNLEFKFVSNNIRYYKSPSAKGYFSIFTTISTPRMTFVISFCVHPRLKSVLSELDDTIGDIMLRINKRESYIMLKLVKYINKHAASIFNAIQLCAELDTWVKQTWLQIIREENTQCWCQLNRWQNKIREL